MAFINIHKAREVCWKYLEAFLYFSVSRISESPTNAKNKRKQTKEHTHTHTHTHTPTQRCLLCICCSELNKFSCIWIKYSEILRKSGIFLKCHSVIKIFFTNFLHCTKQETNAMDSKMYIMALAILPEYALR